MSVPVAIAVGWAGLFVIVCVVGFVAAKFSDRRERIANINVQIEGDLGQIVDLTAWAAEREHRANRARFHSLTRHSREFDESHSFRHRLGAHTKSAPAPWERPGA